MKALWRAVGFCLGVTLLPASLLADCAVDQVDLRGSWGSARFTVELADDDAERSQGLMFRESMPRSVGMLFIYPEPQRASFWMKNTLIPLDMVFIDAAGVVKHVHSGAVPGDLTPIDGGTDVLGVLEINSGLAQAMGIAAGTELRHPAFGPGASWGCQE